MMDEIEVYRQRIDTIDKNIIDLLVQRMDTVKKIGALKKQHNYSIENTKREDKILKRLYQIADNSLTRSQINLIFNTIFKVSKEIQ